MLPSDEKVDTYKERSFPLTKFLNRRLDAVIEREAERYVKEYAYNESGELNEVLAERIRFEVHRRGEMGKEIDVFEPLRAQVILGGGGVAAGVGAKIADSPSIIKDPKTRVKTLSVLLKTTAIATTFTSLVQTARILSFARFKAGLYAGAQTARRMYDLEQRGEISHNIMSMQKTQEPEKAIEKDDYWRQKASEQKGSPNPEEKELTTSGSKGR